MEVFILGVSLVILFLKNLLDTFFLSDLFALAGFTKKIFREITISNELAASTHHCLLKSDWFPASKQ